MSSQIPIAIIGCKFGVHLARELQADADSPFRIRAVCDLNAALANTLAEELGVEAVTDYRRILADKSIPAVVLLTSPEGRAKLLHEMITAGKDVMTTKPFEIDAVAARWVLTEARHLGRVVHLNSPSAVISDDLRTILGWEKQYDLGRPAYFYGSVHASYHEMSDGSWYDDHLKCPAPPIFRLGIYLINDIQTLWGVNRSVRLLETRLRTGRPTADNAILSLKMENGAVGAIAASFCVNDGDPYRNSLQLSYERGTIYRSMGPQRTASHAHSDLQLVQSSKGGRHVAASLQIRSDAHKYDWSAFAESIERRESPSFEYVDRIVRGIETVDKIAKAEQSLLVD